ncbi:MAG: DUF3579 domain-containing protein [Neisseriaceae bacterium]|nr:DUF3579 domain-containing protein [Neisseriaceae bacterium]
MSEQFENCIIIQGITKKGKTFRPSDWSDRLSGILSSFDRGHRLAHHKFVRPQLINQVRCVIVDKQLESVNPDMFRFLMDFAGDNELQMCDGENAAQISANMAVKTTPAIRVAELLSSETALAFDALSAIYPQFTLEEFTLFINDFMRKEGYRMVGVFKADQKSASAVCGFRTRHSLRYGGCLRIEDWAASDFSAQLNDFIQTEAARLGGLTVRFCDEIVQK